jgi:hypothetical protein
VLGAGVLAWFVVWRLVAEPAPPARDPASVAALADEQRWSAVLEALDQEVEAREELSREVAELRGALAAAGLLYESGVSSPVEIPDETFDAGGDPTEEDLPVAAGRRPGFAAEALVAAGLDPARAAALRERWEEYTLEKLYLRDQAAREGWMMSPRHRREQNALANRLRDEIGEEDYGALLYATGEPNTVEVTDVLARSLAHDAGLEPGDRILRYDGARIFRPNALRLATAAGELGEFVSVEVDRDGRLVTLRVRRGPLGVLVQGTTRAPRP